jgi:hypothetical protein
MERNRRPNPAKTAELCLLALDLPCPFSAAGSGTAILQDSTHRTAHSLKRATGAQLRVGPLVVQILQPRQGFLWQLPLAQDLRNRLRRKTRQYQAPHYPCRLF